MRSYLHLSLETHLTDIQGVRLEVGLFVQSMGGPADEVGGKERQSLLQINGGLGADFEMMQEEYLLPNVQLFFELIYWAQLWQNSGVPTPTLTGGAQWIAICLSSRSTVWSANIIKPLCETARCVTVAFPRL